MSTINKLRTGVTSILVLIVVLVFLFPLRVPYSIDVVGSLLPAKEWVIVKDQAGRIHSMLYNREERTVEGYDVNQFDRQDAIRFVLNRKIAPGCIIKAGESVGVVYSSETERQIAQLEGQLANARASLEFFQAGEKEPEIVRAEEELRYAIENAATQRRIVERLRTMIAGDYISKQEFEIEENRTKLLDIQVSIAEAQLQTLRTGAKPEQVRVIQTQISSIQKELDVLRRRLERFSFVSPIAGRVLESFSADTLVRVAVIGSYAIVMPIDWHHRSYVDVGQYVRLRARGAHGDFEGAVTFVGQAVRNFRGREVFFASATAKDSSGQLVPGLSVTGSISYGSLTISEYLGTLLTNLLWL